MVKPMRDVLGKIAALAAGAAAMYYLDPQMGRSRRTLLRDRVVGASHIMGRRLRGDARYAADHVKGVLATGHLDRMSRSPPQNDAQLRERIRSRLGRLVSHPRAIEVEVDKGVVRLSGAVLAKELDGLLSQVRDMPGVMRVFNALSAHETPTSMQGQLDAMNAEEQAEVGRS